MDEMFIEFNIRLSKMFSILMKFDLLVIDNFVVFGLYMPLVKCVCVRLSPSTEINKNGRVARR